MRSLVIAVMAWTAIAVLALVFDPGFHHHALRCPTLAPATDPCRTAQAAIGEIWWRIHVIPLLLSIALGYAAIVLLRVLTARRRPR